MKIHWISGCIEDVKECLRTQDVDGLNGDGKSALHLASMNGNVKIIKLLIKNGANVNVLDNDKATPLIRVVEKSTLRNIILKRKSEKSNREFHIFNTLVHR